MLKRLAVIGPLAALLLLAACGGGGPASKANPSAAASAVRTPVIVDTDMSWDDVVALVYLLKRPDVDLQAITVAGDGLAHCNPALTHVRELVAYVDHPAVPVACGREQPLKGSAAFPAAWREAADAFFGLTLPDVPAPASGETALELWNRALLSSPRTVVVSLGPMTDIADVLTQLPAARDRIGMIDAMAGAISVAGNEPQHGVAEWNAYVDPYAAELVLKSGIPLTLVPLDAASDVPVTTIFRDALDGGKTSAAHLLRSLLADPYYYTGAQYFWDPATAMIAISPGVARLTSQWITVVDTQGADYGRTIQAANGAPVRVAVGLNAARFYQDYLRTVLANSNFTLRLPASRLEIAYSGRWSVSNTIRPATGPLALTISNERSIDIAVVVGKVTQGRTVSDVDAALEAGVTTPPSWFETALQVAIPAGHPATWSVDLSPGLYVVVGGGQALPLQRLAAVNVP